MSAFPTELGAPAALAGAAHAQHDTAHDGLATEGAHRFATGPLTEP